MREIDVPTDVKNKAMEIYESLAHKIRKGKKLIYMVYFAVYCSYVEMGIIENPIIIASKIGMNKSEIAKAFSSSLSMCVNHKDGNSSYVYMPPDAVYTPQDFVPIHCRDLSILPEHVAKIKILADIVTTRDKSLLDESPQTVAGAIILVYVKSNGLPINKEILSTIIARSDMTITKFVKRITNLISPNISLISDHS